MAKSPEEASELSPPLRLSSRPVLSPELSPKTGTSELAFDESSFNSGAEPEHNSALGLESEIAEIRQASEAVRRSAQDNLNDFRVSSASVKRKILSMERQINSLRSSFVDYELGSKSSLRGIDDFNNTYEGKREQQLTALMKELQGVQELLQDKEQEYEKREKENIELKKDLERLEQLVAEAARRKAEGCVTCECHKCCLF